MLCQNKTLNKKPLAKNEPQSVKKCLYTRVHEIIYAHTSVHNFFEEKVYLLKPENCVTSEKNVT